VVGDLLLLLRLRLHLHLLVITSVVFQDHRYNHRYDHRYEIQSPDSSSLPLLSQYQQMEVGSIPPSGDLLFGPLSILLLRTPYMSINVSYGLVC
jgi:hypothetical protein